MPLRRHKVGWRWSVDEKKYDESWTAAAQIFRGAVTREAWAGAVASVRGPLGKLKARQLRGAQHKTSLPGAPDGDYVVVQFTAAFANKAEAVETITPMLEADGTWKVSGYFIR